VLWLVYGNNNGLTNQIADRYSRALNSVHNEVNNRSDFYKNDGVSKLSNYIAQSGGIDSLSGYAKEEVDTFTASKPTSKKLAEQEKNKIKDLLTQSYMLNEFGIEEKAPVPFTSYFKATDNDFSLLLVQRTDSGFNIVDVDNDATRVNFMLANALRKRFDLCVFSIRPILELIQTQCLPKQLENLAERLIEKTELPEIKTKKFESHRRVLFTPKTKEFILSPINALTGVVSIVKPYFDLVLDGCEKDVYMPYVERNQIEKYLLRDYEFNYYDTELKDLPITEYPELNSASYVVHLRHRTIPNTFQNISFWPFYSSLKQPQYQLAINPDYTLTPNWYAHFDKNEIKRVNDSFLENWINGHGKYLTRAPHQILKVTFGATSWKIEFVYEDNDFVNSDEITVCPVSASSDSVTVHFRAKDLIPELKCLADLPITNVVEQQEIDENELLNTAKLMEFIPKTQADYKGGVCFELDNNVLCIKFYTDTLGGSEHTIYIPTANKNGQASTAAFIRYEPEITADQSNIDKAIIDERPELVEVEL
jgi:hypothetical protein